MPQHNVICLLQMSDIIITIRALLPRERSPHGLKPYSVVFCRSRMPLFRPIFKHFYAVPNNYFCEFLDRLTYMVYNNIVYGGTVPPNNKIKEIKLWDLL